MCSRMSKPRAVSMSVISSTIQFTEIIEPFGRAETRLKRHPGIDLDPIELAKILVEQPQPLVGVVVAVEEQLGVGWVIMPRVKFLELLIGEVWNVLRIAAGVEPIGNIRIERLL